MAGIATSMPSNSSLHYAAAKGNAHEINTIIIYNVPVDSKDRFGNTPLHYASETNYPGITAVLIESGADVNARNRWGETPLHTAASNNNARAVNVS